MYFVTMQSNESNFKCLRIDIIHFCGLAGNENAISFPAFTSIIMFSESGVT